MRVLLIQPPLEDFYTTPIRLYPLGLLYAASVFRWAGWEVQVLDCLSPLQKRRLPVPRDFAGLEAYLQEPHFFKGYYRFGIRETEIVRRVKEFAPDLIGISSQFTAYYKSVEDLVRSIKKEAHTPVVLGGNHATVFAGEIEKRGTGVDLVLPGPAENSIPRFLAEHGYAEAEPPPDWKGIRPAHDLIPSEAYKIGRKRYVSMIASRGCPCCCAFCSVHRMFGRRIDYRPVESVLDEMRANYIQRETRLFNFEDDNLSLDRVWFLEFLEAVARDAVLRDIELTAMNGLCYPTLDEEILQAMKKAGFRQINLSLVTGSAELRASYRRPAEKRDFEKLVRKAQELGLFITVYIILGLPGQDDTEIKRTVEHLFRLGVLVGPSVFYLSPGSELYDKIGVPPEIKNNWNLHRSSAFAVETEGISRSRLLDLFLYIRKKNLERRQDRRGAP